jgi:PhnB protein
MPKNPPEGYHSLNAYIAVEDANKAIEFYKQAFGAQERVRMPGPEGKIGHAELQIGDSVVMLSDPFPQSTTSPPKQLGGTTTGLMIYVDDADAVAQKAIDAGAELTQPLENMFWGDRFGQVKDPFGHVWQIATHIEDVPPEEMAERAKAAMASMAS